VILLCGKSNNCYICKVIFSRLRPVKAGLPPTFKELRWTRRRIKVGDRFVELDWL